LASEANKDQAINAAVSRSASREIDRDEYSGIADASTNNSRSFMRQQSSIQSSQGIQSSQQSSADRSVSERFSISSVRADDSKASKIYSILESILPQLMSRKNDKETVDKVAKYIQARLNEQNVDTPSLKLVLNDIVSKINQNLPQKSSDDQNSFKIIVEAINAIAGSGLN
jgi:hypothetical protein